MVKVFNLTFLCFLFSISFLRSQQNIVPNPNFELYDTCPNSLSQINFATNWVEPTPATSDYFNSCCTLTPAYYYPSVPYNYFGYQNDMNNGNGYSGVFALYYFIGQTYREYIQAKLTTTLIANQKYFVSLYVSLGDSSRFGTDDFGILFSSIPINSPSVGALPFFPQISNPQGQFLVSKNNWTKISGSFIAGGNEQYITIGNFKDDLNTDTIRLLPNRPFPSDFNSAYYLIDKICCSTDSTLCNNTPEGIFEYNGSKSSFFYNPISKSIILNSNIYIELMVIDIYGKILKAVQIANQENVDLSGLMNGIYLIILKNKITQEHSKIIIGNSN
jgi:hypothetical protein